MTFSSYLVWLANLQWEGKQRPENTVALTLSESLIMPLVSYQCTFCCFISFSETRAYIFYSSFLLFGPMRRKVLQTKVQLIELNFLMLTWTFHTSSSLTRFFIPLFFLSGGFLRFLCHRRFHSIIKGLTNILTLSPWVFWWQTSPTSIPFWSPLLVILLQLGTIQKPAILTTTLVRIWPS